MMRNYLRFILCLIFMIAISSCRSTPFKISDQGKGQVEIQIPSEKCPPIVEFAARELKHYLEKITAANIKIQKGITPVKTGRFRIVLGNCPETVNAGLDVATLPPDGFFIKTVGNSLFLCGRDAPEASVQDVLRIYYTFKHRGTLLAVYHLLEKYCGIRWLFPGQYGEYVPVKNNLSLPEISIREIPGMKMRINSPSWNAYDLATLYGKEQAQKEYMLFMLRMGYSSWIMAKSHYFAYDYSASRWIKTHPEFFAVGKDGKRVTRIIPGQGWWLDFTNPALAREVAKDVITYFQGKPAATRNLPEKQFQKFGFKREAMAINAADTPIWSYNPECKKYRDADGDYSELAWFYYMIVSDEVAKACPEKLLSVWSYADYHKIPKSLKKAPDNVRIYIITTGPFEWIHEASRQKAIQRMKEWYEFSGHKMYLWVNASVRACRPQILDGVPSPMISEMGPWVKNIAPYMDGVYFCNPGKNYLFEAVNTYLAFHLFWNPELDAEKLLSDYYEKAYGPGAKYIRQIEEKCEKIWDNEIMTVKFKTGVRMLGDKSTLPSWVDIWENIYNEQVIHELEQLMAEAVKDAQGTQFEKRVNIFKTYYLGGIQKNKNRYLERLKLADDMIIYAKRTSAPIIVDGHLNEPDWQRCEPGWMSPLSQDEKPAVETEVRLLWDKETMYIGYKCHEPRMDSLKSVAVKHDEGIIWKDDEVEAFFDPTCSRKNFFQILANATGKVMDLKHNTPKKDVNWASEVKIGIAKEKNYWTLEMAVDFKSLETSIPEPNTRWLGNFCRGRALTDPKPGESQFLTWSRLVNRCFNDPSGFGIIQFIGNDEGKRTDNLLKNGNFEQGTFGWGGKNTTIDNKIRWTGLKSFKLEKPNLDQLCAFLQRCGGKIKPNTEYVFSFYMKTKDIKPLPDKKVSRVTGAGAELHFNKSGWNACPDRYVTGTHDWRKYFTFIKTDSNPNLKAAVRFQLRDATGTAWIDDVRLIEVKE